MRFWENRGVKIGILALWLITLGTPGGGVLAPSEPHARALRCAGCPNVEIWIMDCRNLVEWVNFMYCTLVLEGRKVSDFQKQPWLHMKMPTCDSNA